MFLRLLVDREVYRTALTRTENASGVNLCTVRRVTDATADCWNAYRSVVASVEIQTACILLLVLSGLEGLSTGSLLLQLLRLSEVVVAAAYGGSGDDSLVNWLLIILHD